ncbi:MAG: class I SAM-dependent methyltransferase [Candidatus Scalindua sp.]|jgi:SAM-dependent methyltransferase|nr:class I SAM-dependent methyltransferase [Candidatus Scalindua sp.]
MKRYVKSRLLKIGDRPIWNYHLQRLANFGDYTKILENALGPKADEKTLDVGCGLGVCAKIGGCTGFYVGVDISEAYLKYAKRHFAVNGRKHFVLYKIPEIEFSYKSFDKAICSGIMHHINDEDCIELLKKVASFTKKKIVIMEMILPVKNSPFGDRLWLNFERGNYMRKYTDLLKLIKKYLEVLNVEMIRNRTRLGTYALITCIPK